MATRFHIGAKDLRGAISAYAKRFDYLEVKVALSSQGKGKPEAVAPTVTTLKKWRKQVPPHFDFGVVAGPHLARLKTSPQYEEELAAARASIDALQARCFLIHTPADVTPGAVWRDRLAKLFDSFPKDVTHVVWEPSGLWEIEDAAVLAKRCGVVLCVDPTREPVPAGNVAYARLRALGETRSFGEAALERVAHSIGLRRDVFVLIESDSALEECKRLRRIAQRGKATMEGGMGRLIRPRGGMLVRDDEQE